MPRVADARKCRAIIDSLYKSSGGSIECAEISPGGETSCSGLEQALSGVALGNRTFDALVGDVHAAGTVSVPGTQSGFPGQRRVHPIKGTRAQWYVWRPLLACLRLYLLFMDSGALRCILLKTDTF